MSIQFLEKDLEDIIFEASDEQLRERGLYIQYDLKLRQLNLGSYGIADIVYLKRYGGSIIITIMELKNKEINDSTLNQAVRYARGIQRLLSSYKIIGKNICFHFILIGRTVNANNDWVFASNVHKNIHLYEYCYEMDGIKFFHQEGWYEKDENFPESAYCLVKKTGKFLANKNINKQ